MVFVLWEQAGFDADQAIYGLMAKHISEGRAFPMFAYGFYYMLAVQAWITAPLFAVFGTSVAVLKVPVVLVNIATGCLLVWVLHRDAGLRARDRAGLVVVFSAGPACVGRLARRNRRRQPGAAAVCAAVMGAATPAARVWAGVRPRVPASRVHPLRPDRHRRPRPARRSPHHLRPNQDGRTGRRGLHDRVAAGADRICVLDTIRTRRARRGAARHREQRPGTRRAGVLGARNDCSWTRRAVRKFSRRDLRRRRSPPLGLWSHQRAAHQRPGRARILARVGCGLRVRDGAGHVAQRS